MFQPGLVDTRHNKPAFPIVDGQLTASQRTELAQLKTPATHLKKERLCPDLDLVVADIQREHSCRVRRERAKALLLTLDREWHRYAPNLRATAVYSDRTWQTAGEISANWIARLRDEAWLTNELGDSHRPPELLARTSETEAIFGDERELFAYGIDQTLARSRVVRALKLSAKPQVAMSHKTTALDPD
jgi:hypothetical protein